ncbi:hypothetical protein [Shewanella sp. 10N.286.54.B9]|uniref:hypothetical protein n=1 Tax=Shewanella sp. 10N.286.54.B9 TaxID=3229719 RepID=UPI003551DE43
MSALSTVCTVRTGSGLPLYAVSASSAVRHVLTKPGYLLRSVSAYAMCDRLAVRNLCAKPGCILRSVSAYAMCNRFAVRNLCTKPSDLLCTVPTRIKPAMCYL